MLTILLTLIFLRPFISSLAFPYLNYIYCGLLLLFLGAWHIARRSDIARIKGWGYPLGLFCLALILSLIFSSDIAVSLREIYKYAAAVLLLLVTALSSGEKEKGSILQALLLGAFLISLLALYQYFFGFRNLLNYLRQENINNAFALDYVTRRRVYLPFVTPNSLGGYLAMMIPLAAISKYKTLLLPPMLLAIFLTGSLGALASLLLATLLYFYLKKSTGRRNAFYLGGILIIIGLAFFLRLATLQPHAQPAFSAVMRLNYWRQTLEIIKSHPLAGVGMGNFNLTYARYAHNSYLQIWAEMGILGVLSIIWLVGYAVKNIGRDNRASLLLLTGVLTFALHNVVDFSFFLPEVAFIWWLILGLTLRSKRAAG